MRGPIRHPSPDLEAAGPSALALKLYSRLLFFLNLARPSSLPTTLVVLDATIPAVSTHHRALLTHYCTLSYWAQGGLWTQTQLQHLLTNDSSGHRRWNLWGTPWTQVPGHTLDRLLWCSLPTIQSLPVEHPACCDFGTSGTLYSCLRYHFCCLSDLWIPYCEPVHRSPPQHLPHLSESYRWVLSTGPRLPQSVPSKCKQPNLAMEHLQKHNLNHHCLILIPGSSGLLIQRSIQ